MPRRLSVSERTDFGSRGLRMAWIESQEQADAWMWIAKQILGLLAHDDDVSADPVMRKAYIGAAIMVIDAVSAWHREQGHDLPL
jgi:hypothetical protein